MKTKTIEELLTWAFTDELTKGGGVDGLDNLHSAWRQMQASSWGKIMEFADLMAMVDRDRSSPGMWIQVHLPFEVRNTDFVTSMTALSKASKPLRSEFARVTAGYDKRGFRLNQHRLNGGALLNSWSGVRRASGEPVLSLRYHHRELVDVWGGGDIGVIETSRMRMTDIIDAAAPTVQRSSRTVSNAPALADYENPTSVPFSNAPWLDEPFGVPAIRVQKGS
ncbi:hypothetical protein C5748_16175 [Phyllobacterium phragmitis]|uniref:Uncharacterized protein n=1 Tax=Phyllobacterium phragmitis TaxID=2670329 RepID=A0A2S9IP89_9HYPH|nr:hypothetical protein [Phyllobacterium phragmitis]PRD42333.1 hypothetical protein C5748_16175 [Phyllobacterium phragmitis]